MLRSSDYSLPSFPTHPDPASCGKQLFEFYRNSTYWLPHDAGSGCWEFQNRLLTALYPFFFLFTCSLILIAPSRVFFE